MSTVDLSLGPVSSCSPPAESSPDADLWAALNYVATFGDTDRLPAATVVELRAAGFVAGPAVAPHITRKACSLLDSRGPARCSRTGGRP